MESPYDYAPIYLNYPIPQFRLLVLHGKTSTSGITCTLRSYWLSGCLPRYKALSYTWGSKENPCQIMLNGFQTNVGRNLWTFLEQMCLQGQYGVYWVDAICIDQNNVPEKNHQVQMMRHIYNYAEEVIIWLGETSHFKHIDSSDTAMDMLADPSSWMETYILMSPEDFYKATEIVESILSSDYWTRIWIVQEIVVAKRISVYCGSKRLGWQSLTDFMTYLSDQTWAHPSHVRRLYGTMAMRLVYYKEQVRTTQKQNSLAELLSWYKYCEASNVLDKVFALCGIASDAENIVIDYNISPRDLIVHLLDRAPRRSGYHLRELAEAAYVALELDREEFDFEDLLDRSRRHDSHQSVHCI